VPTTNIYTSDKGFHDSLISLAPELRKLLARELTCGERALAPTEISIRVLSAAGQAMIAPIEVEITAHAYGDRAARADKICLLVREFLKQQIPSVEDVRVWLILAELGHSWEE
jgi:hypothetical protein